MTLREELQLVRKYAGSVVLPFQGPDAARYMLMAEGAPVASPFYLRWFLPKVCGTSERNWWVAWWMSYPIAAAGMVWWAIASGSSWQVALAAAVFLVALPGLTGVRPTEVSLPSMAIGVLAAASMAQGWWPLAVVLSLWAATIKESTPVWVALWCWNPIPLLGLLAPLIYSRFAKQDPNDPVTSGNPVLERVRKYPILTALEHHRGQWRNGWLLVAPWGVTLAALYRPTPAIVVLLLVTYAQLLVATDLMRLLQTAAGPAMALAAAQVIPVQWLLLAAVVHVVWWREPVRL